MGKNKKKKGRVKFIILVFLILMFCFSLIWYALTINDLSKPNHSFSVGKNKHVYFASSNLIYKPSTKTWGFAENAYDYIGKDNELISKNYNGWIDLFAWGANGLSGTEPYNTISDNTLYGNGHKDIAGTKWDFSNAANKQLGDNWRMFTNDEIHYLLMKRTDANKLFGYGTINGIKGLFILPDDWKSPQEIIFTTAVDNGFKNIDNWYYTIGDKKSYAYNKFTIDEWKIIEEAGAVFLPAAGFRVEASIEHSGISGHYWTSSHYGEEFANCLCLFEKDLFLEGNFDRSYGLAVRLVKDAK